MAIHRESGTTGWPVNVAVAGAGYWGQNHVRNFDRLGVLTHICDSDSERLRRFTKDYPDAICTNSYDEIIANPAIAAVVIATPAETHFELASKALLAGKDVLVEKPMALSTKEAEKLLKAARDRDQILMVGHILLYHPAVIKLKEILERGDLGKIQYIQSNRLSMGKVRSEENILWSFAPHDISTILYLLGEPPNRVYATGYSHLQKDVEDVTISILDFPSGAGAHIYLSWMNPFKEHRLVVLGDKKMAVFEDSRPEQKLRIFNNSFEWVARRPVPVKGSEEVVEIETSEPLSNECVHFLDCVVSRRKPTSDGEEGFRVLQVLQECYESMKSRPIVKKSEVEASSDGRKNFSVHDTAVLDESASIGEGTQIWHFSHVMKGAQIGKNCRIGQNCFIGKGVRIGDNCKIQNNVSVYEGITLEDNVFCGPSMVFTNVYNPRCEIPRMNELRKTVVSQGATIGANSTILCGTTIGKFAFIGAGAVVLKDVSEYGLMVGNPAKRVGWMCRCGIQLKKNEEEKGKFHCPSCDATYRPMGANLIVPYEKEEEIKGVPLLDLKKQYLGIKTEIDSAIGKVVESQRFIGGPEVEALEREMGEYCRCKHAVGVSSGTDALLVSMMALGVSPGDEVITTPFTFFATVGSILRLGAKVVFADIDPVTFNIDPAQIKGLVTDKTKAIVPVHLFGQCAEMAALLEIANEKGIPVVEDAAQAIGAEYLGKRAGSIGTVGCFSFFPSKNLGAFGDGGMITTNDDELAGRIRVIRNQGAQPKYFHPIVGGNFRLDAIQAAVLRVKLKHLDSWSQKRRSNAAYYSKRFAELGLTGQQLLVPQVVNDRHVFNQYVIRVAERDPLRQSLKSVGVETEIYYPHPAHLQVCMNGARYQKGDFPASENACETALALPIYPELQEAQMEYVISRIKAFYSGTRAESGGKISTFYDSSYPTSSSAPQGSSSAR